MFRIMYLSSSLSSLSSLYTTLLTSPPPPPLLPHLCKKKYCIKVIFMYFLFNVDLSKIFLNLTANIIILGTYTHFC